MEIRVQRYIPFGRRIYFIYVNEKDKEVILQKKKTTLTLVNKILVKQQDEKDCGVACLATIINYHRGESSLERLRELSGTSKLGTTLLGLKTAAKECGLNSEGFQVDNVSTLRELKEPAILLVTLNENHNHYIVFFGFKGEKIIVGDPLTGEHHYSEKELDAIWKSKALLQVVPNESFTLKRKNRKIKVDLVRKLVQDDINLLLASLILGIVIASLGLTTAIFSQKLIDNILPSGNNLKLILSLILVTFLLLARIGISSLRGYLIINQSNGFNKRLISGFYSKLLNLRKSFFDSRKTGDLITRMNDTSRIQTAISFIFGNTLIDILVIIISCVYIFYNSLLIGALILITIPFYVFLTLKLNKPLIEGQKDVMNSYSLCESHYIDSIQGISTIKSLNKQIFFGQQNEKIYGSFLDKAFKLGMVSIKFGSLSEIVGVIYMILVFGISSWMVLNQRLQLGEMVALTAISGTILPSIGNLVKANIQLQEAITAFERMFEFANLDPEFSSDNEPDYLSSIAVDKLIVDKVSFAFPGRPMLLKDISLEVKKGEIIAILGESGGGKSTVLQLLQKFYKPDSGIITCNNNALESISTPAWRSAIAIVPQDIKIFNGPLLYNITLSDHQADFEKAFLLCEKYGLTRYFNSLPQGFMTLLGEEGINISGGQKQLVALARALYVNPKLLLLDEVTSSLDRDTENYVLTLLSELKKEMAIVLVTHRTKTADIADRIYVLKNGEINDGAEERIILSIANGLSTDRIVD